jgi:hypothetical protein
MSLPPGRRLRLSLARRFLCDFLHFAQSVPAVVAERRMNLQPLVAARQQVWQRPCWYALFVKAYALVASQDPLLRRCYRPWPWPHLYEHGCNVASVPICRPVGDDDEGILFLLVLQPEKEPLDDLHDRITGAKTAAVGSVASFRQQLRISRLPLPVRRLVWWLGLHGLMSWRLKHFGTFGITGVAGGGSDTTLFLSPLTTTLTFGVIEPDGEVTVRLLYDHRVLDGERVGRALERLEETLRGPITAELFALAGRASLSRAA